MKSAPHTESDIMPNVPLMDGGRCGAVFKDTCVVLLAIAAVMKLWMVFGDYPVVHESDPILRMPFRGVFSGVAIGELGCAYLLVVRGNSIRTWQVVAAFLTLMVLYRIGLWLVEYRLPCTCLGVLPDWLGLSPKAGDRLAKSILTYLALGVGGMLVFGRQKSR